MMRELWVMSENGPGQAVISRPCGSRPSGVSERVGLQAARREHAIGDTLREVAIPSMMMMEGFGLSARKHIAKIRQHAVQG